MVDKIGQEVDVIKTNQPYITISKIDCLSCKHWIKIEDKTITEKNCLHSDGCIATNIMGYDHPIICISDRYDLILEELITTFKQGNFSKYFKTIQKVDKLPLELKNYIMEQFKKAVK